MTIAHLYPDELGLYGDRGNVLCLVKRAERRGYNVSVKEIKVGDRIGSFDILFIGGGQDKEMRLIAHDLLKKSDEISYAVHSGKVILAICGGYQLLGEHYEDALGNRLHLTGALSFYTKGGKNRMIGNTVYETSFGKVVGFENHGGMTFLGNGLSPLGKVIRGWGNNGIDGGEGLLYKNTFATYAHGPVLPKNPRLADELIKRAMKVKELAPLDDRVEELCHNQLLQLK